ncbi:hypothetical protein BVRB_5g102710 isoform B [Beta vulgaris subsp. vulgaris]|uniref:uncharacterized protein LOC104892490 isoform X3 n=1 Tax=Beta vulgaris subsp. vulgaris TaxID=3555 RepID=UPI00053FD88A|nr:uncharacterized protein LOC104892490 isoform X3 [Beta vulgaris subsp. vulgaris]KMT12330.1 hypothetical protein BVRB_5g102710 isoform B [Beta vulgaris subsp. vulgaris]
MAAICEERINSLIDSVTFAIDTPSKLESLHQLKQELLRVAAAEDTTVYFSEFIPSLLILFSDCFSPVRKCVTEVIGEIGLRHLEVLPETTPALLTVIDDDTSAVARQAITSGTNIFCRTLERIAIEGLHASKLDSSLESAWEWMVKLKEKIYSIAFEPGSDGRRLLALKFVAAIILIYTPDPNGSTELPTHLIGDGKDVGFNISWLRRGHPILKLGDLSIEASQSLGLLLDQLRVPIVKSLSTSMVVVLINCLSAIAVKRPSFYGRILPVLLGLDPSNSVIKGLHAYGVQNALKNAFLSCLKRTHPSATPWRDRLVSALREMNAGDLAERALEGVCNINGNLKEKKVESVAVKEEPSLEVHDPVHNKVGRKRSSDLEVGDRNEDDDTPGKRARSMGSVSDELADKSGALRTAVEVQSVTTEQESISNEDDLGPVKELIGLFGALVAQGKKAAPSLEALISAISADLLSEVVIANLRNLPSTCPKAESDEDSQANMNLRQNKVDTDTSFEQLSSFLTNAFHCIGHISSSVDVKPSVSHDIECPHLEESHAVDVADNNVTCTTLRTSPELIDSDMPCAFASGNVSEIPKGSVAACEFQDLGPTDTLIPGLDNAPSDGLFDIVASSSLASTDRDDCSQDQNTSFGKRSMTESLPSVSNERSEELSSKTAAVDANIGMTSTATSVGPVHLFVLPKMSAPVVDLSSEDKDTLQKLVFLRIVEAYKQVAVSGGSQLRFSLLSYLGVQLSLDLDLWTCLQTHILSDYTNHEGHELTLRVLYRLYGEAEEERDFFSSTTATSVYETFLLKVAETLRDSFPASDKSLSRLFSEVPYLPKSSLKLLESLCSPEIGDKDEKELHNGDRVTQGLSAVWSLILQRPTLRDVLLKIALQSAIHHVDEVRMKAIRLVANKLYPLPSIALQIEEFAKEKLLSVVDTHSADAADTEKPITQIQKNSEIVLAAKDQATGEIMVTDSSAHTSQSRTLGSLASTSVSESQRCMSLYFALCTKKHALLRQIFIIYKSSPESVKQAVHSHMPILIRTMGTSPPLLEIISDAPDGSENLLIQVLHTLTDGRVPSAELIFTIKNLYETKLKDIEILFPILPFLPKEEVLRIFPHAVNLPQDKFQAALTRLLQGPSPSGPVLTPPEVLIAIHSIDPDKDGIPLKKVTDACNACFEQRQMFTQQVIAKVLNQLVEQIPLPLLFMRTVLQAIGAFPALVDFIMEILFRLVNKQIWKYPKLWVGFLKCAQLTQPHSFNVLLQLPLAQLEGALNKIPALKAPLAAHANQQNLKSTLPRSILVVLGIASDSQAASQSQSGQPEAGDAGSSEKDVITEKSKESSGGT